MADPNAKKTTLVFICRVEGQHESNIYNRMATQATIHINQLSDIIKIGYKTIQHHIQVLENNLLKKIGEIK